MRKTLIALLTMMIMIVPIAITETVYAEEPVNWECTYLPGKNTNSQDYSVWSSPVYSYLTTNDNGYMRLQGNVSGSGMTFIYYDHDFRTISRGELDKELDLFGGFYESDDHYYIVTGQENPDENNELEVYRITKYDKNWNRIGSCGLYGANTTVPFNAGCCRMDMTEQYLVIRTSHEMYKSSDGNNHQANVTILVDTDTMTIADSYTEVGNGSIGYVSHSFNQFVRLEDNKIVSVDHGDAIPRSICLMQYPTDVTTGHLVSGRVVTTNVMRFSGSYGNNATGASVGGFEISDDSYLIAGNSVVQDDNNLTYRTRNVFISAVDKDTKEIEINWLTSYEEGEGTTTTPQMIKIDNNRFFVAWGKDDSVFYTFIDGQGKTLTDTFSLDGDLSDCVPVLDDGKIIWYTWDYGAECFYQIPIATPETPIITEMSYGHDYEWTSTENGLVTKTCRRCGEITTGRAPTSFETIWRIVGESYYSHSNAILVGLDESIQYKCYAIDYSPQETGVQYNDFCCETDQPENCIVNEDRKTVSFRAPGRYNLYVYPKYNPDVKKLTIALVRERLSGAEISMDEGSIPSYGGSVAFTAIPTGGKGVLHYQFVLIDSDGTETVLKDYDKTAKCIWKANQIGEFTVRVNVKDTGDNDKIVSAEISSLQIAKAQTTLKEGTLITSGSEITYGQKISELPAGDAVFVSAVTGETIEGTLEWKEPDVIPDVGEQNIAWKFTPNDQDHYVGTEGTVAITVKKAETIIEKFPDEIKLTYHPLKTLGQIEIPNGTESVPGSWQWNNTSVIPTVTDNAYEATFIPEDEDHYTKVVHTIPISVEPAEPFITEIAATGIVYKDQLAKSTLTAAVQYAEDDDIEVAGSCIWKDATIKPFVSDSNKTEYEVVFIPEDTANYKQVTGKVTLVIEKADFPIGAPQGTFSVPFNVTAVTNDILSDYIDWEFSESSLGTALIAGESLPCTVIYTGDDAENYESIETTIQVERSTCQHENTETRGYKEATCTELGYSGDKYCVDCGELLEPGHDIEMIDHDWKDDFQVDQPATCEAAGRESKHCANCDATMDSRLIPPIGHKWNEGAVTQAPTCTDEGVRTYTCLNDNTHTRTEAIPAIGHDWDNPIYEWEEDNSAVMATRFCKHDAAHKETETVNCVVAIASPTCEEAGCTTYTAEFENEAFETQIKKVDGEPATGHDWDDPTYEWAEDNSTVTATRVCKNDATHKETETANCVITIKPVTCEEAGFTTYTAEFENEAFETQTKKVDGESATGHDWDDPTYEWAEDNSTVTATRVCKNDASHAEIETVETTYSVIKEPTDTTGGIGRYTSEEFKNEVFEAQTKDEEIPPTGADSVTRIYGSGRYETAFLVADELKEKLGVEKFDAVILADGRNYPDALAGSYLSSQFEAPILLVNNSHIPAVQDYIKENLSEDGVIYILGGTGAVPDDVRKGMDGYTFERLAGASRYETNLEILKAGPANDEIVVCTGKDYADSLSASAVGRPILLVKNTLQDNQKTYLESLGTGKIFYIIGGEGAVTKDVENALKAYGTVKRVFGSSRYDTSVAVAEEFFPDADAAVLAYGQNFPDGLCGGALACYINGASGQGAPLILTRDSKAQIAAAFTSEKEIKSGAVLGGTALISDESVRTIFDMNPVDIIVKTDTE